MSIYSKRKNKIETGFKLKMPYSDMGAGLFVMLARGVISGVTALILFNMIFKGFNIECDFVLMRKIIFGGVFVFSLVQINLILCVGIYGFVAYKIYEYAIVNKEIIKNGFLTMANQCYGVISEAMSLPSADGFDKVMENTYLTVNTVSGIVAVLMAMFIAFVVVRLSSRVIYTVGVVACLAVMSFFELEVSYKYVFILLLCFGVYIVLGMGNIKSFRISIFDLIHKRNRVNIKSGFVYGLQLAVIGCVMAVCVIQGFKGIYSAEKFKEEFNHNYSENIKVTARDVALMKYAEYKHNSLIENVSMGQIGYVAYVKPNVKANVFNFIAEPISEGKIYFKNFIGKDYNYRYNGWTEAENDDNVMVTALKNVGAKSKEYEIYNGKHLSYLPYYSESVAYDDENKAVVTAYDYENVTISDENYNKSVYDTYLQIDDENKAVIDKICAEQGFSAEDENLEEKLKNYLINNFTYTTEKDPLPYGKDFVNYFLEESKSGSFLEYASALTLIYRDLGIPARYVGGYAVETEQTLGGSRVKNSLNTNTQVKQANLYSWVEIYNKEGGWQIVDIVPAYSLEELDEMYGDEAESTYTPNTSLESYFSTVDKEKYTPENMAKVGGRIVLKIVCVACGIAFSVLVVILGIIFGVRKYRYYKMTNSQRAFVIMDGLKKRLKVEGSYRDLERVLSEKYGSEKAREVVSLGERCIFAEKINKEDVERLKRLIRKL